MNTPRIIPPSELEQAKRYVELYEKQADSFARMIEDEPDLDERRRIQQKCGHALQQAEFYRGMAASAPNEDAADGAG